MTTTPHAELLTDDEIEAGYHSHSWGEVPHPFRGSVGFERGARWAERALLARLGEQQPVAWAVGLPGEPIKQQALWTTRPTDEDVRFATTQGGFPLPALVVTSLYAHPPAAQPVAQGERDDDLASAWIAGRAETYAEIHPNATLAEAYQAGAEFALRSKGLQASRSSAQGAAQVPPHQGDAP